MIKFIKLTECKGNTIVLNVARIEHFTLGAKGTDTYIKLFEKDNYFFVKEDIDTIWNMINDNSHYENNVWKPEVKVNVK